MPLYHFNVRDGRSTPDDVGTECPDLASARREAEVLAGRILLDADVDLWREGSWMVDVTDAEGISQFALVVTAIRSPDPEVIQSRARTQDEWA